jgi:hypothetical protein
VQALTVAGVATWWLIRASLLLSALSLDVARHPTTRALTALWAVNWTAAKHRALRFFMAFGTTCGVFALIAIAVNIAIVLTEPAKPYPRTTILGGPRSPGPILVEFGPQTDDVARGKDDQHAAPLLSLAD